MAVIGPVTKVVHVDIGRCGIAWRSGIGTLVDVEAVEKHGNFRISGRSTPALREPAALYEKAG